MVISRRLGATSLTRVGGRSPVGRVRAAMEGVAEVRADPAPNVATVAIGVDRLDLTISFWHDPTEGTVATSAVATEVAATLRALELDFILGTPVTTLPVPAPLPLRPPPSDLQRRLFIPFG